MSLILRSPTSLFLHRMMDFFHDDFMNIPSYSSYLTPTDTGYVMEIPVPGMTKDQVHVTVEDRILSIQAKSDEKHKYRNIYYTETLPRDVLMDSIQAGVKDGLLRITMEKCPTVQKATTIPVH